MLQIFLGSDDFSKREYVQQLAKKEKAQLQFLVGEDGVDVGQLIGTDLFAVKKLTAINGGIKLLTSGVVEGLLKSNNTIIFFEEKLDKRLNATKELLANKNIKVQEFNLPHGSELNVWIEKRVAHYNAKISKEAVELLAKKVGRDDGTETKFGGKVVEVKEVFTLWQVDNEIKKLVSYSAGQQISVHDVDQLVVDYGEAEVLDITNAIAAKDKQRTFNLINRFLKEITASDEKGKIIQLNALLAEQFRNVAMIQSLGNQGMPEGEILQLTSWKSGRLFVIKKIASQFDSKKVLDFLSKLEFLDAELKSSSVPPRVILDLILTQLVS